MMTHDKSAFSTQAVHAGEIEDTFGSPHTPLYSTTTFKFDTTADLLDVVEGRKPGCLYTRYGTNPTINSLEVKLAALDRAEGALVFSAGMAAISALFLAHGRKGIVCIGDVYGGTWQLLGQQLPALNFTTHVLLANELDRLQALLASGSGLVFFESPTNPTLDIIDIRRIVGMARQHGALVAIDNTFASPVNQQPHALGVDMVVYSATKYLGGHSDITAGVVTGNLGLLAPIGEWRKNLGQMLSPDAAHLLSRSLCTLEIRVQRQNESATAIAQAMSRHPRIRRVLYPGLPAFAAHALAASQMSGFGGMLTIEVAGSGADAARVVDRLRLFSLAPSLGGVESLATQPITTSHHDLSPEERQRRGIGDAMIRLSVGLEDPGDLIADLEQALAVLG